MTERADAQREFEARLEQRLRNVARETRWQRGYSESLATVARQAELSIRRARERRGRSTARPFHDLWARTVAVSVVCAIIVICVLLVVHWPT